MTHDLKLATVSTRPARQQHTTSTLLTVIRCLQLLNSSVNFYRIRLKVKLDLHFPVTTLDDTLIHFLCVMVSKMTHNLTHAFSNAKNRVL
jgi:hypothetical protein